MKKIALFFTVACFLTAGAMAQTTKSPAAGEKTKTTNKVTVKKKRKPAKPAYEQNFDICKNNRGYYICGQTPTEYNSAFSQPVIEKEEPSYRPSMSTEWQRPQPVPPSQIAPHGQSYPANYVPSVQQ